MTRLRNRQWDLPNGSLNGDGTENHSWQSIQIAVLMDIRDELQGLNRLLGCSNFTQIPQTLKDIQHNTRKPPRKRGVKANTR